ncbi:MAG: hypothetical protein WCG78_07380 [Candidatus Omnitrophota bacterium]
MDRNTKYSLICCAGVSLILAIMISGCGTLDAPRRGNEGSDIVRAERPLNVATNLKFEDLPVPAGFSCLRDQSFVFQDGATRVGLMRYAGRPDANQILNFYRTQMSLYNWDLLNTVEYGNTTMNFIKGSESCVVTIEPLTTKTVINIIISPKTGSVSTGFSFKKDKF